MTIIASVSISCVPGAHISAAVALPTFHLGCSLYGCVVGWWFRLGKAGRELRFVPSLSCTAQDSRSASHSVRLQQAGIPLQKT